MNIQAVTLAIPENEEDSDWVGFSDWASGYVKRNLSIDTHVLTSEYIKYGVDGLTFFDKVTSLKLLLFEFFPKADRIFFYDCDWRPVRQFNLWDYVPEKEGMYFVEDRLELCNPLKVKYGMRRPYFNSGFFIVDRKYAHLFKYCYDNYHSYQRTYVEQCVLNQVCEEYVEYLDPRLNVKDFFREGGKYKNSEILGYHNGHNYAIFKGYYEDQNWDT